MEKKKATFYVNLPSYFIEFIKWNFLVRGAFRAAEILMHHLHFHYIQIISRAVPPSVIKLLHARCTTNCHYDGGRNCGKTTTICFTLQTHEMRRGWRWGRERRLGNVKREVVKLILKFSETKKLFYCDFYGRCLGNFKS